MLRRRRRNNRSSYDATVEVDLNKLNEAEEKEEMIDLISSVRVYAGYGNVASVFAAIGWWRRRKRKRRRRRSVVRFRCDGNSRRRRCRCIVKWKKMTL